MYVSVQLGTYFPITSTGVNEIWGECTLKDVTGTCPHTTVDIRSRVSVHECDLTDVSARKVFN